MHRQVTEAEFLAAMKAISATRDKSFRSTGVGDFAFYYDPAGQLAGRIVVRYWKGEEEFDYFISAPAPPAA